MFVLKVPLRIVLMVNILVMAATMMSVFCSAGKQCNGGPRLERDWNHRSKPQKKDPACSTLLS